LIEKEMIPQDGQPARVKRRYDDAQTPFDRLCQTDVILPEHRQQLEALRDSTNPRRLRQQILDAIEHLFTLPGAVPGIVENVYHSLAVNHKQGDTDWPTLEFNRTPLREQPA